MWKLNLPFKVSNHVQVITGLVGLMVFFFSCRSMKLNKFGEFILTMNRIETATLVRIRLEFDNDRVCNQANWMDSRGRCSEGEFSLPSCMLTPLDELVDQPVDVRWNTSTMTVTPAPLFPMNIFSFSSFFFRAHTTRRPGNPQPHPSLVLCTLSLSLLLLFLHFLLWIFLFVFPFFRVFKNNTLRIYSSRKIERDRGKGERERENEGR